MKYSTLFSAVALFAATSVAAQSMVRDIPALPTDTAIVRQWKGEKYVVYNRQGAGPGQISYHDNPSGLARTVDVPAGVLLYDMRIFNDTLYACGTYSLGGSRSGLIACLAIPDLISGSGQFNALAVINPYGLRSADCPMDYDDHITGVKRIEVFREGGRTVVSYLADNEMRLGSTVVYRRVGDGSVTYDASSGSWVPCPYHYNKDGKEEYTDLAVMDDCIAIVSRENEQGMFCFDLYKRQACHAANTGYPSHSEKYRLTDHKVEGRVMATALPGNRFAAAYHYRDGAGVPGMAVRVFSVSGLVPTLQCGIDIPLQSTSSVTGEMEDIRYSRGGDCLWILNNTDSPVTGNHGGYVYRIDMANVYAGVYWTRYSLDADRYLSLDQYGADGFVTVAAPGGHLRVRGEHTFATTSCMDIEKVVGLKVSPVPMQFGRHHCTYIKNILTTSQPFAVYDVPVDPVCNY